MKPMPAKITKSTTNSLTPTSTMLTRIDSLMPMVTSVARTATSSIASTSMPPPGPMLSGQVMPMLPRNTTAYALQPCATTLAPSISSSSRSQPMIQAMISPRLAYENVYADPDTGTVDANSA